MHNQRGSLIKTLQSVTMRQVHGLKNQMIGPKGKDLKYTRFHSQFGEDRYVFENIPLPTSGVFVDVGAGHPVSLSNTYFFEQNGWTGVCIDADPVQVELLKSKRANVEWAAVAAQEGELEFTQSVIPTFSSAIGKEEYKGVLKVPVKGTIKVPAHRLETILEKHGIGKIDLLDIDVEGLEIEVWKTMDYEKHKPRVVVMEFQTFGLGDSSTEIRDFFATLPYTLVHTTCTNFIFVNNEDM